jgi:DNA-binding HxlR family transcriptional regulator
MHDDNKTGAWNAERMVEPRRRRAGLGRRHADPTDPLDAALARVGDRWSLLVVGTLMDGPRRFGELLDAAPGLAPNILSHRLKHLEAEGILVTEPYSERPPRSLYRLTAVGRELAGALRLLAQWGAQVSSATTEPTPLHHAACGTPVDARWWCPTCAQVVEPADTGDLDFA